MHRGWTRRTRPPVVAALLAALLLLSAGCERRSDGAAPAPGEPVAHLLVTAGFGGEVLHDGDVAARGSVLDGLRAVTDVRTAYGGAYVSRMYGRGSDLSGRRDWFFYVDGILADRGAADVGLDAGTRVWWDHRYWGGRMDAWAVVGSWPAPFTRPGVAVAADPPLDAALTAAGARTTGAPSPWRVRVGSDADLRAREPAWARAAGDPDAAGLTGIVAGDRVELLGPAGDGMREVPGGRALVVAMPTGSVPADGVTVVVAGVTGADARAAAATIARRPEVLAGRYAVAFDGAGEPVRAAGREGP